MLARGAQGEVIPRWEGVTFSFLLHTFPKHNTHMHAAVNGDCVALKFKDTLEDSHLRARRGRRESDQTKRPLLYHPYTSVLACEEPVAGSLEDSLWSRWEKEVKEMQK